ncbi:MAG: peptide/nickel transport system substrate-binding protein [Halobacteriales archaeon]|jgi:peptide/nickel transport system substrate-binding protein
MADDHNEVDRRNFLKIAGTTAAVATTSLAGCTGDGGGDGEDTTTSPSDDMDGEDGDDMDGEDGDGEDGDDVGGTGSITYGRGNDSGTLDPQATSSGEDAKVIQQVYDQVIQFEPGKTTLQAGLAKEFSLEGTSVKLTLREGAMFHNGEEFTSADFEATYRRFLDEEYENFVGTETRSYYGPYLLSVVDEVKTPGDYEVELDLKSKHAPMLRNLAVFAFGMISKTAIESDMELREEPVGTGPFNFESWSQANGLIRLKRYADHWGTKAKVNEVVFSAIPKNSSRAQALQAGDVDIIDGMDAQTSTTVDNAGNAELITTPGINVGYLAMNMARREEFRDRRVRRAFNYAVDTGALVDSIYSGLAVQASQPVPENMAGYNDSVDPYPYDPDEAQSLLEEAGYGDGFEVELATFRNPRTYNPSPSSAAQLVKSNLEDVGLTVTINTQEFNAFLEYTNAGKHDACFLGWMTDNADPDNFFNALLTPGVAVENIPEGQDWVSFDAENFNTLNSAAWANREYTQLVMEGQSTYDEETRRQKYEQASKIAHDEAPWVFLDHAKELRGVHNRVSGFVIAPISGPYLNRVSVE